jgi:hypothetical protein
MTERPRDTSLRDAFVGILMTVGPFFGVRYRPPRVEIPVVTTPATEAEEVASSGAASGPPPDGVPGRSDEDGIVI